MIKEAIRNSKGTFDFSFTTEHPEYLKRKGQWSFIRDWIEGTDAIKSKKERYLPRPVSMSNKRYDALLKRAVVVNYVDQTLEGVHGMVFRRTPVVQVPDEMKKYLSDIDREGNSLYQFLSDSVYDIMITNFGGYLVDMPKIDEGTSVFEAEQLGVRPYITYYPAESIINWKFKIVNGSKIPILVVLKEICEQDEITFTHEVKYQYRVLRLQNGIYTQYLYRIIDDKKGVYDEEVIPVMINGKNLTSIPFVFAPSKKPEKPMLKDIAEVNLGHYQKSADYENGIHLTTIPTGYVTGEAPQQDKDKNIIPIALGEDEFLMFPNENAHVGILNYAGEGLSHCEDALRASELQMVVLGSRIITPEKGISETAESANIHRAGENAKLATFANNMSTVITKAINIMIKMLGVDEVGSVRLNTDYETQGFDANALNAMANVFSQGKMPLLVLYRMFMRGEYLDPDMRYEDYVQLLELEASGLSPSEVYESYKMMKNSDKPIKLPKPTKDLTQTVIDPTEPKVEPKGNGE